MSRNFLQRNWTNGKKIITKIVLLTVSLLMLITLSIVAWNKYDQYRLETSKIITQDEAVQIATSYLNVPNSTPIKAINLVKAPLTKNENAWEVVLDYEMPNKQFFLLNKYKVYVNCRTGEVLAHAETGVMREVLTDGGKNQN
jgi:hypothetical protein